MLSEKQKQAIAFSSMPGFASLACGRIRSGKTYSCVLAFGLHTQRLKESYTHLLCGRKLKVIENELLGGLENIAKMLGVGYEYSRFNSMVLIGQQKYVVAAGNDEKSQDVIMGLTCHSALIDEATKVPKSFYDAVVSRLSFKGSKIWVSCNPGSPLHFLKKEWLDAGKFALSLDFNFEDNPMLDEETKERYRGMFAGVFKSRMVDGAWSAGEGLVYPHVALVDRWEDARRYDVAIDYGTASTTAMLVFATFKDGTYGVVDEKRMLGGSDQENKTDTELALAVEELANRWGVHTVVVDPSASSFRAQLLRLPRRRFAIRKANNDLQAGIRFTLTALSHKILVVRSCCEYLIEELQSYSWDEKKEDTPIKLNDHFCDALRYGVMDFLNKNDLRNVELPEGL